MVPAVTVRAVFEALTQLGADPARLGLALPDDELARVRRADWDAMARLADETLGRATVAAEVGMAISWGHLGVVDYLVASSADVVAGLRSLAAHFAALASDMGFELLESSEGAWARFLPAGAVTRWDLEFSLGLLVSRFRTLAPSFAVHAMSLRRPPAPGFAALFGVAPAFRCQHDGIALADEVLRLPLTKTDPQLHAVLQGVARRLSLGGDRRELELAIRARLRDLLPLGQATLAGVARCLGRSPRSLSRDLAGQGQTFRDVLASFRADESERLMLAGRHSLAEIASSLGYGDQSAWTKAFRRWRGLTPRAWLEQAQRQAGPRAP